MTNQQERMTPEDEELFPYGDEHSKVYKASGGSRKNAMLLLVPHPTKPVAIDDDDLIPFADIRRIKARKDGRGIRIECSAVVVLIAGRNLLAVARAIGAHSCSCIRAFNPAQHTMPDDLTQPFIDTIGYYVELVQAHKTGTAPDRNLDG